MSDSRRLLTLTALLLFSLCVAPVVRADYDDPTGRVARLSNSQGDISYSPGGEDDWMDIERNRPLYRGDRLWTDRDARAEFQMGNAAVRLGPDTSFEILNLDDDFAQMRLAQGTVNLRVRRMYPGQAYEIATPALSFTINRAGRYRIDVDPYDDVTTIVVWEGAGEAYGEDRGYRLRTGDTVRFYGSDLRDHEMYGLPRADAFDRYCFDRDQILDHSISLHYVDDDIVGYSDLDDYGDWRTVSSLGTVWFPRRVGADWAPYRDGHWAWLEPWGWTWIDDAPWGFAPSHYGRWVYFSNRWGWIPGQRNVRSIYSPALVVFIGGRSWNQSRWPGGGSPIGWFPLGPREVYVPSYRASRDYFTRVNVNNTVINNTTITNVYNNYSSGDINVRQATYANRRVAGAVTAVPTDVFVNAKPVRAAKIRLDSKNLDTGDVMRVAEISPSERSVLGTASVAKARPPREAIERQVMARKVPPPAQVPFAAREQQLKRTPGRAPDAGVAEPAPGRDVSAARKVRVVKEEQSVADVRESQAPRADGNSQAQAPAPAQLQPLDRSVKPEKVRGHNKAKDEPAAVNPDTQNVQQQSDRPTQQQPERQNPAQTQPQGQRERPAATQQQEALRRQAECEAAAERAGGSAQQANRDKCRKKDDKAKDEPAAVKPDTQNVQQQSERQAQQQSERQAQQQSERQAQQQSERQAQQQSERQNPAQSQPQGQRERQAAAQQQEALRRQAECEAAAERAGGSAQQANKDKCGKKDDKAKDERTAVNPGAPNAQTQSNRQGPAQAQAQGQREPQATERQQEELRRQAECEAAADRLGGSAVQANKDKCKKKDDKAADKAND